MKVLRIRQIKLRAMDGSITASVDPAKWDMSYDRCGLLAVVYLNDRGIEAPDAKCVVIYKGLDGYHHEFDTIPITFTIKNDRYTGFLYKAQDHEYTISQISRIQS